MNKAGRPTQYNPRELGRLIYILKQIKSWLENENELFSKASSKNQRLFLFAVAQFHKEVATPWLPKSLQNLTYQKLLDKAISLIYSKKQDQIDSTIQDGYNELYVSEFKVPCDTFKSPAGVEDKDLVKFFENNYNNGKSLGINSLIVNHLQSNYISSDANLVWCSDTTEREGLYVTIILDLASRFIVGSFLSVKKPTGKDMILLMHRCMSDWNVKPIYFHSDQGSYYKETNFQEFLSENNITWSADTRHDKEFGNQVMESLNRKIWSFLDLTKKNKAKLKEFAQQTVRNKSLLVEATIDHINTGRDLSHAHYTPQDLFAALTDTDVKLEMLVASNSQEANFVYQYHAYNVDYQTALQMVKSKSLEVKAKQLKLDAALEYVKITKHETLDAMKEKMEQLVPLFQFIFKTWESVNNTLTSVAAKQEQQLQEELKTREALTEALNLKNKENKELSNRVNELILKIDQDRALAAQEKAAKEEKRRKKKERERLPLRTVIEPEEIQELLASVKGGSPFSVARDKISLLLLFVFGLRIDNLRKITVAQLKAIKQGKEVEIELVKNRERRPFRLTPSEAIRDWFDVYHADFKLFFINPELKETDPFYNTSREYLNRRLNQYFKELSIKTNKYLRSHSARVTLGTKAINNFGVAKAKNLLGHKSIVATMYYDRNELKPSEQRELYDILTPEAPPAKPHAGKPRVGKSTKKDLVQKAVFVDLPIEESETSNQKTQSVLTEEKLDKAPSKRGRPRKNPLPDKEEQKAPRKRGRPPKAN